MRAPTLIWMLGIIPWAMAQPGIRERNPCAAPSVFSPADRSHAPAAIFYDSEQDVCWLANANLAADAEMRAKLGVAGVNPNGTMDYQTALNWIAALNAFDHGAGYLGHNNWQLPVAPLTDKTCADTGSSGGSFGPDCGGSAMGGLYYLRLRQIFPNSVAPLFTASIGPAQNLKLSYYWAAQNNGGTGSGAGGGGQEMFSFANGLQGQVRLCSIATGHERLWSRVQRKIICLVK